MSNDLKQTFDLEQSLSRMKSAWMMGGSAEAGAPPEWNKLASQSPNAELALLALSGQAIELCFQSSPSELAARSNIPKLQHPSLPDTHRASFRRALSALGNDKTLGLEFIRLIANRGYCVHPLDWMPSAAMKAPDIYAPWQDWQSKNAKRARIDHR